MNKVLVLDLDDTLYSELNYLKSAYHSIASELSDNNSQLYELMLSKYINSEDVFSFLVTEYNVELQYLLDLYRYHIPNIQLYPNVDKVLNYFSENGEIAIVTDGRSKTQRNKLRALGLTHILTTIVISEELKTEKPCRANFEKVVSETIGNEYIYIGDNLKKDFITPKDMGWTTICLKDQGNNIHKQNLDLPYEYQPDYCFESWLEIQYFLNIP